MIDEIIKYGKRVLVIGALASLAYTGIAETFPKQNYVEKVENLVREITTLPKQSNYKIQNNVLKLNTAKTEIQEFVLKQNYKPKQNYEKITYQGTLNYNVMKKELEKVNQALKQTFGAQYENVLDNSKNPGIIALEEMLKTYKVRK